LLVLITVPVAPTAQQFDVVGQLIPARAFVVPDVCDAQLEPPFVVFRTTPPAPADQQLVVLGQLTPARAFAVPDVCDDHVEPPFVVDRIVPEAPTDQHVLVLAHATAASAFVVPDVCEDQVTPPLVVPTVTPLAPAAIHVLTSAHATPARLEAVPDVCRTHVAAASAAGEPKTTATPALRIIPSATDLVAGVRRSRRIGVLVVTARSSAALVPSATRLRSRSPIARAQETRALRPSGRAARRIPTSRAAACAEREQAQVAKPGALPCDDGAFRSAIQTGAPEERDRW